VSGPVSGAVSAVALIAAPAAMSPAAPPMVPAAKRVLVRIAPLDSRPSMFWRAGAMITILAIAGTLSACGRYGSPVRVAPAAVVDVQGEVQSDVQVEIETDDTKSKDLDDGES